MQKRDTSLNERVATLEQGFKTVCQDIKEIKNTLLSRPSWSVLLIISALSTISTSLIIYIVINH